ncbi:MAG: choice-of-anchor J domain-containing protein [Phycisphaerales bacterium]
MFAKIFPGWSINRFEGLSRLISHNMQKYIRVLLLWAFFGFGANLLQAQTTTILDQTLLTQASFNSFTNVNVTGTQNWYFSSTYGAICNGYSGGQSFENEDWLISPEMNLTQANNVKLSFSHTRGSASVLNVGVTEGWYKVFATSNYTGNPVTTQWVELTGFNQSVPVAWQYISSGDLVIPEAAKSANSRIAFRYMSSATQSATWEIKNVKVTGEPVTNPNMAVFKITNWNTEWLGCTTFGPTDETLQINNVAAAMLSMNADIYCIQEVSNTAGSPSIATLVSLLGSSQWEGKILPASTDDCDQRQGIIYKKAKVQFVSSAQLSSGNAAQGNSYYYNWTSGRYPSVYNVNLISGSTLVPVSIINIHAKSEDGEAMSYTRRLGASQALKTILDGSVYNSKNLVFIGDFNDYMVGTSSNSCSCTDSPYKNFVDDQANYTAITQNLTDAHWNRPVIENIIVSNELAGNYVSNSVGQEVTMPQNINNYYNTTSDHLPVSALFQFQTLGNPEFAYSDKLLKIYPNPVKSEVRFDANEFDNEAEAIIYDLTGRQIFCEKTNATTINVGSLPSGTYILKVGGKTGRFIKS